MNNALKPIVIHDRKYDRKMPVKITGKDFKMANVEGTNKFLVKFADTPRDMIDVFTFEFCDYFKNVEYKPEDDDVITLCQKGDVFVIRGVIRPSVIRN